MIGRFTPAFATTARVLLFGTLLSSIGARSVEAQQAALTVLVVDVSPDTDALDPAALRTAIGKELGVTAVPPTDPRANEGRGTIHVELDAARGQLEVTFDERQTTSRRIPAPSTPAAIEKATTYLAGNLARHEAADLALWLEQKHRSPGRAPNQAPETTTADEPSAAGDARSLLRRTWFSVTAEIDMMYFVSADCGYPEQAYACVNSDGSARSGPDPVVPDGFGVHNSRATLGGDYALSDRWRVGARLGWSFRRYPGELGSGLNLGPLHLEARTEYLFGSPERWAAPYVVLGAGAGNFDGEQDLPGIANAEAWRLHGPLFVTSGFGLRIPFSVDVAANMAWKVTLVFPADTIVVWSPEISTEFRF